MAIAGALFLRHPKDLKQMASLGLMGVAIPSEHGGAGMDALSYALAIEEVSANGSAFTPVIVEAAPPCAEAPAASMARAEQSPMIEITIGIATVRFAAWIDPAALAAVLRAVRAAT